ncbi:MAG: FumA C-terminus/TtdB family hydratase beta subunit [Methanopyraceae archaeon]
MSEDVSEHRLTVPVKDPDELLGLKVGDIVYLDGTLITARDKAHQRMFEEGREPPVDLKGAAIFHAGPVVREVDGDYELVVVGPTTSTRMAKYLEDALEAGVRVIVGKGGMGAKAPELMKGRAVYLTAPGGCAALLAERVKRIRDVHWLDLGIPEAMWVLEVSEFGPLIVTVDAHGNELSAGE